MDEERDVLDSYMLESVDFVAKDWQGVRSGKFWKKEITERGILEKRGDPQSNNRRFYMKKMGQ